MNLVIFIELDSFLVKWKKIKEGVLGFIQIRGRRLGLGGGTEAVWEEGRGGLRGETGGLEGRGGGGL